MTDPARELADLRARLTTALRLANRSRPVPQPTSATSTPTPKVISANRSSIARSTGMRSSTPNSFFAYHSESTSWRTATVRNQWPHRHFGISKRSSP